MIHSARAAVLAGIVVCSPLAARAAEGDSPPETRSSPEGDRGIATKYVGDVGIANDPEVIYATSFENGIQAPLKRQRKGVEILNDPKIARTGNFCAKITATRNKDTGGDLKILWKEGVEQCFVRVYLKFHKDTAHPHHFLNMGGHTPTYKYRWGGSAGLRPPGGTDGAFGTTLEPPSFDKPGAGWLFYTYWHRMRSWHTPHGAADGRPNAYYGNVFKPDHQRPFAGRDKWICVEFMVKLNTIGKRDGEQAFWIDGEKVGHWGPGFPIGSWMRATFHTSGFWNKNPKPFEGFSWRSHESLKINKSMLQWYLSNRTWKNMKVDKNIVYYDNYVIARKYIGPIAERKAAPRQTLATTALTARARDPLAAHRARLSAAERLTRDGNWSEAAAAYRKVLNATEDNGAQAELKLRIEGIEARPRLVRIITEGLKAQGVRNVYIDFAGRTQRAKIVKATAEEATFQCSGSRFPMTWRQLSGSRLAGIAATYVAGAADRFAIARFLAACGEPDAARAQIDQVLTAKPSESDSAMAHRISAALR